MATARCSASFTAAASAGACREWRSPRRPSRSPARVARLDSVELYDGLHLPAPDDAYDLGILSHVLEHVPDPPALLAEVARVCRAVLVEVPLEDNLSAKRASKREHAEEVGHLQRLSRDDAA